MKDISILIPDQLIKALFDRKCSFFIGAGMSEEAGLPSAKELSEFLLKKLEKINSKSVSTDLKTIASKYEKEYSRPELKSYIREIIVKKLPKVDKKSFELISQLIAKPTDIITTNWDSLLEETIGKENYIPIFEPKSVSNYSTKEINLIKIHGDLDRDIIITEDDYLNYKENFKSFIYKLLSLFQEKTIVFIGYSLSDFNFLEIYMEIFKLLGNENLLPRYCVDPFIDDIQQESLRKKGIIPIISTARDFLKSLNNKVKKNLSSYSLPSPKTVPKPLTDYNPFSIFRMEDVIDVDWVNKTFVQPVDYIKIVKPGNIILEGHRGSGKTMILQYLNYASFIERNEKIDFVGFYIKLQNSFVDTIKKRNMKIEEWKEFFLHYFNLLMGESILLTLKELIEDNKINFQGQEEFAEKIKNIFLFDIETPFLINSINSLLQLFTRERNRCAKFPRPFNFRLSPHFIYDFIKILEDHIIDWKKKFFYILIDEYDKLDEWQQRVVNLYIADRGGPLRYRVSFKIGVKLFDMTYNTIDNKTLDDTDDYTWIPLDRFDEKKQVTFINTLKEIGKRRLNFYGYRNESLKEIFPSVNLGFEQHDYSGLGNILTLSSFLIRDFLELTKDMVYYAFPWIINERRDRIPKVPPYIQNFVIAVHSDILYTTRIDEIRGKIENYERKYNARLLIEKLGVVFQLILKGSKSKELRTVSSFQLRDEIKLNKLAKAALEDCRGVGVLQVPYIPRRPQDYSRHAPHRKYEFHRLLCPRFNLSLLRRWPKEINAEKFNQVFISPDNAVNELAGYFLTSINENQLISELITMPEIMHIREIYKNIRNQENIEVELLGKPRPATIEKTLLDEIVLKIGKKKISCESIEQAKILKQFAELGFKKVIIPRDRETMLILNKKLISLFNSIKEVIQIKLDDYPLLKSKKSFADLILTLVEVE